MQHIPAWTCLQHENWADLMSPLPASKPQSLGSVSTADRRRVLKRGVVALAFAWLAWFYWFSRAALLTIITVAVGVVLFLGFRTALRMLQAGGGIYRQFCLRLLLSLARRMV